MRKLFLLLFLASCSLFVMAQQGRIDLRSESKVEITKNDFNVLQAKFTYGTIESSLVETEKGTFSAIAMPNTVIGGNEGDPQIPVINEMIAVPFGATPHIEVTSYSATDYQLSDYGINKLVPRQPSLRKDKRPEDVPFIYNESAYQTRGLRSEPMAMVYVDGTMRGVQIGKMTVEPVSYDPVNNTLRVFNDIEVEVHFDGADFQATEQMLLDTYSPYFDIVYQSLFNGRAVLDVYSEHPDLYSTPVKMLVVTTSTYTNSTAFQNWLNWKKQKGIDVDIYTVTSSTSASSIRSGIQSRYNSNHPSFLVIVGDETVVTHYQLWDYDSSYGDAATDLEYASVDSDIYHDMFLSRMPVSNTSQLTNLVNKILTYEKYTMTNPSYLSETLLIAGWDSYWTPKIGKPTINYGANNYFKTANGITPHTFITTASGQTDCYNYINNVGFVNYTAHGDIQEWHDPNFTNSKVNSLTNSGKPFWAMGNCCLTANFKNASNYQTSFGETMVRAANGAFGYIGSVPESYWYEDLYFGVGAYNASLSGTTPSVSGTTKGAYDALFDETGFNSLNAIPFIGNIAVSYAYSKNYSNSSTSGCSAEYYWRGYQCFGDGSVMPYVKVPAANNVSHENSINIGSTSFTVHADAGSYVAITKDNVILGVAAVPSNGVVDVPITGLNTIGNVMIVVTRNQRQPYITTISVSAGSYIALDSYTPTVAIPGEQTNMSVVLKNIGNEATTSNATVSLSCSDNRLTFGTYTRPLGVVAANATKTVSGFTFTITDGVANGTQFPITVTITDGEDTWEATATVTATAPTLAVGTITDSNLEPGTNGTISIPITNTGSVVAQNIVLTMTCSNSGVSFSNNSVNIVSLAAGASTTATFDVSVAYNVTYGSDLNFSYTLTANHFSTNGNYVTTAGVSEITIGSGTNANSTLPTCAYKKYSLSEQIYTVAEIGRSCTISAVSFQVKNTKSTTRNIDLYMKHTDKTAFSSNTDWVSLAESDKVYSGNLTFSASGWTTIVLSTPFVYNGTDNLIIGMGDNTGSNVSSTASPSCYTYPTNGYRAIYINGNDSNYNPASMTNSGNRVNVNNQIQLNLMPSSTVTVELPTVTTTAISEITQITAMGGGEVTEDGNAEVTARGICWSIIENPTIEDDHTADGAGTGSFTSSMTGLTASTTYYVRAYATNSEGTAYGEQVSFTTLAIPEVVMDAPENQVVCHGRVVFCRHRRTQCGIPDDFSG